MLVININSSGKRNWRGFYKRDVKKEPEREREKREKVKNVKLMSSLKTYAPLISEVVLLQPVVGTYIKPKVPVPAIFKFSNPANILIALNAPRFPSDH